MHRNQNRPGFTLVELIICVVIALVAVVVLGSMLKARPTGPRHPRDASQVRGIHQGLVLAAAGNQDRYPLPSLLDAADTTIAAPAETKDTTSNILSYLIYNAYFSPELCVSPAESNAKIRVYDKYSFSAPPKAAAPQKALWDPTFNADFTKPGVNGHTSYAHNLPSGERLKDWRNTFSATTAVLGNRGPQITGISTRTGGVTPALPAASNTYAIYGGATTWEGCIVFNDNHVEFATHAAPESATYTFNGASRPDLLFFDETDDDADRNAYLGIWTQSGATPDAFKSIWD